MSHFNSLQYIKIPKCYGIFAFDLAWEDIKNLTRKSNSPILFIRVIYIEDL